MNEINEKLARDAKSMNSFSDYIEGSATNMYNRTVSEFNNAVEELKIKSKMLESEKSEKFELIDYYVKKYATKLAMAINKENEISARVPSIMICGAGNFPVSKKEKQVAAMDKFWHESGELFFPTENYYFKKIQSILSNETIYSNDVLVIEKLENKLTDLTEKQEEMKAANAYYRKNGTMKGYAELTEEESIIADCEIKNGMSWEQLPYQSYKLTNNNGAIKQTRDRLEKLKKEKESGDIGYKCENLGFEVKENKEIMRLQLFFEVKPDEATRTILKKNGFVWSPSQNAWQRQLTDNARYALKNYIIKALKTEEVL